MKETIETINAWARETFPDATNEGRLNKFLDEAAEYGLVRNVVTHQKCNDIWRETIALDPSELPDLLITAYQVMADHYGSAEAAQKALDDKMAINRARVWTIRSDGTGQHI